MTSQGKKDEKEQVEGEKEIVESLPNTEEIRRAVNKVDTSLVERKHESHVSAHQGSDISSASHIPSSGFAAASNGGGSSQPNGSAGTAAQSLSAPSKEETAGASRGHTAERVMCNSSEQAAANSSQQENGHSRTSKGGDFDQTRREVSCLHYPLKWGCLVKTISLCLDRH